MGDRLLAKEDTEVSELIRNQFERDGIDVRLGHAAKEFAIEDGEKV